MSIRPIDLQVIVPKAQLNPAAREHMVHKEAMQLQQAQMENKQEATIRDNRVNELTHKDGGKVEEKKDLTKEKTDKKKKKLAAGAQSNSEKEKEAQAVKKSEPKGWNFHRFDMKV